MSDENEEGIGVAVGVAAAVELGKADDMLNPAPPVKDGRKTGVYRRFVISYSGNPLSALPAPCPTNKVWEVRSVAYNAEGNGNMAIYIGTPKAATTPASLATDYVGLIKGSSTAAGFMRFIDSQAVIHSGETLYAALGSSTTMIQVSLVEFDADTWYAK